MEREVSSVMQIAVALLGVSALISIIFVTVFLGRGIQEDAGGALIDIKNDISLAYIEDLQRGIVDTEMPSATAHNIFQTYETIIAEISCGHNGEVRHLQTKGSCLQTNLKGRVELEFHKVDSTYIAFVHHEDCTWQTGRDTCNTLGWNSNGFKTLKTKYKITTKW